MPMRGSRFLDPAHVAPAVVSICRKCLHKVPDFVDYPCTRNALCKKKLTLACRPNVSRGFLLFYVSDFFFESPLHRHTLQLQIAHIIFETHMQSPPRILNPIHPIPKTYHNTLQPPHRTLSLRPHLSNTKTHSTLSKPTIQIPPHLPPPFPFTPIIPVSSNVFPRAVSSYSASHPDAPRDWKSAMPGKGREKGASREVQVSRCLSYLLRHGAREEGIGVDEAGWANVADVVGYFFMMFFL